MNSKTISIRIVRVPNPMRQNRFGNFGFPSFFSVLMRNGVKRYQVNDVFIRIKTVDYFV